MQGTHCSLWASQEMEVGGMIEPQGWTYPEQIGDPSLKIQIKRWSYISWNTMVWIFSFNTRSFPHMSKPSIKPDVMGNQSWILVKAADSYWRRQWVVSGTTSLWPGLPRLKWAACWFTRGWGWAVWDILGELDPQRIKGVSGLDFYSMARCFSLDHNCSGKRKGSLAVGLETFS